jgi:mRNA-degrading endonuclease toxin of MazEF toxin-antitoxin module
MKQGEVYFADFPEVGRHPVIVISAEGFHDRDPAIVVVCAPARFAVQRSLPGQLFFPAGRFGFTVDYVAQAENLLSIDRAQVDLSSGPIGVLDDVHLLELLRALGLRK